MLHTKRRQSKLTKMVRMGSRIMTRPTALKSSHLKKRLEKAERGAKQRRRRKPSGNAVNSTTDSIANSSSIATTKKTI